MTLRVLVMIAAAAAVLLYIWWRERRACPLDRERHDGVLDEAATAYEDIAEDILFSEDDKERAVRDHAAPAKPGPKGET
ncbi:hypothetical protein [Sphingomonas sp. SRS2]|uniref:hypothetical protein n=1 Tax=Sphingomonas sp. SRS2 TaxID=133190 RepID=UPI0006184556|nr:hypothetical protein [Sphingomonas sp. SRS2]KKC27265.1 hypothetical protein WP12_04285 [Sphingomonas sp. SRS2]